MTAGPQALQSCTLTKEEFVITLTVCFGNTTRCIRVYFYFYKTVSVLNSKCVVLTRTQ
jgi:hypothetical protein